MVYSGKTNDAIMWPNFLLTCADVILTVFLGFPLSVLHWRGTWELQDVYFFPADREKSLWTSFAVGANVCVIELLIQPYLSEKLATSSRCLYTLVSRLHLYIHGWAVMCYWRGLWELLDLYLTTGWINAVMVYFTCQLIMVMTRTARTAVGIPISLRLDTSSDLLEADLVFKTSPTRICAFVLDCLFTQFVIVSSAICIWRSIWNILDAFVFPHRHYRSDVVSLIVGLSVTLFYFAISCPLSAISNYLSKFSTVKLLFEDFIFLILTWANLLLYRGAWNLCLLYFLPAVAGDESLGAWVSHIVGTVGLMALQLFNTVGLHNIERDGVCEGGEGMDNVKYLRQLIPKSWWNKQNTECDEQNVLMRKSASKHFGNGSSKSNSLGVANGASSVPSDDELLSDGERSDLLRSSSQDGSPQRVHSRLTPSESVNVRVKRFADDMLPLFSGDKLVESTIDVEDDSHIDVLYKSLSYSSV